MRIFVLFLILLFPFCVRGQFTYQVDQGIPVADLEGNALSLAWAGGVNAAQYNTLDLNGDGKDDLLLFDRMGNKPLPFLRENDQYVYAPAYESFFPADLLNWVLLRDFNCDGKKDIFTGDIFGMKVYINSTQPGALLSWKPFLFYEVGRPNKSIPLLTEAFSTKVNLQMTFDDLPAIEDADGDGDFDIFNFRFSGTGTIEFHRNNSMEKYGTCDSLDFKRITQKWAGITECNCGEFAFNNTTCPAGGRVKHTAGKSLQLIDVNGDGKRDLLMSEATCTHLYLLQNNNDVYTPDVTTAEIFPFATPINFLIFPAAFYEDVDFDGVKDLISTPNIYKNDYFATDLRASTWFYKNIGTNADPDFSFVQSNFLQDRMIDVGDNAVPAFADYDGDGDYDMFVSQYTSESIAAGIYLFENTGTVTSPSFRLITKNYLNLRSAFLYNLKIQFGYFNNDNRLDLVFTANSFDTGTNNLYYILNEGTGKEFQFDLNDLTIHPFELLSPENVNMADIDMDGRYDLLVGRITGAFEYWRNTGTDFVLTDESFLGIESSVLKQSLASDVGDLDVDGKVDLIFGDPYGEVSIISDFRNAAGTENAILNFIYSPILDKYERRNLGGRVWPTIVNLYGTNRPSIVVGNLLGGVSVYQHTAPDGGSEKPFITLHPNPATRENGITLTASLGGSGKIISANGQTLTEAVSFRANEATVLEISNYAPGLYILQLLIDNKSYVKRFVIQE
jgi:hypothetical protein